MIYLVLLVMIYPLLHSASTVCSLLLLPGFLKSNRHSLAYRTNLYPLRIVYLVLGQAFLSETVLTIGCTL